MEIIRENFHLIETIKSVIKNSTFLQRFRHAPYFPQRLEKRALLENSIYPVFKIAQIVMPRQGGDSFPQFSMNGNLLRDKIFFNSFNYFGNREKFN